MAQRIETHYDNLKVMRDAPVEDIKLAYRKLAQKYHPDRNPGADSVRIMTTINQAWAVLSDPERRAKHDRWIADREQLAMQGQPGRARASRGVGATSSPAPDRTPVLAWYATKIVVGSIAVVLAVLLGVAYLIQRPAAETELNAMTDALVSGNDPAVPAASNAAGHVTSEEEAHGPARFEFNNSAVVHEVEVRMFRDGKPSRRVFVPAGQRFVVSELALGTYTMHFKIVVDGKARAFRATDSFPLVQTADERARGDYDRFSKNRVTMMNLADGRATEISPGSF